jgi:arylsulfatase A-like enzyme
MPVSRHPAERGAHPVQTAFMDEEVAQSFQRDDCIETVRPAYQGLVSELDHHLGRVWETLTRLDLWKDTLVIFCADHGDYLGDHWLGEKELFHDCIQKVPFILVDPQATRRGDDDRLVQAIDVVPTILDALGLAPAPHLVEGRSLLALTRGGPAQAWRDVAFSELDWTFRGARLRMGIPVGHHHAWMVRMADWKYVHWSTGMPPQLFDLRADPEEFFDLGQSPEHEAVRAAMKERLLAWFGSLKRRTTITWEQAEAGTDTYKKAGVFYGQW